MLLALRSLYERLTAQAMGQIQAVATVAASWSFTAAPVTQASAGVSVVSAAWSFTANPVEQVSAASAIGHAESVTWNPVETGVAGQSTIAAAVSVQAAAAGAIAAQSVIAATSRVTRTASGATAAQAAIVGAERTLVVPPASLAAVSTIAGAYAFQSSGPQIYAWAGLISAASLVSAGVEYVDLGARRPGVVISAPTRRARGYTYAGTVRVPRLAVASSARFIQAPPSSIPARRLAVAARVGRVVRMAPAPAPARSRSARPSRVRRAVVHRPITAVRAGAAQPRTGAAFVAAIVGRIQAATVVPAAAVRHRRCFNDQALILLLDDLDMAA
jgi:hypothetical protein